jgi:hypothetical protein
MFPLLPGAGRESGFLFGEGVLPLLPGAGHSWLET